MKTWMIIALSLLFIVMAGAVFFGPVAEAEGLTTVRPGGRGGAWEFYLPLTYADSATVSGQNGASLDIDPNWALGYGFGYNFNDNFQLNGLFTWNARNYNVSAIKTDGTTARYSNTMYTSNFTLNGVYYILKGNVTPFVSGGVGITYVDTSIPAGLPSGSCWSDPVYGYVCSSDYPTRTENDISYNAGIGVRYDASQKFALQFGYYKTWIDISKASSIPDFDIWRLDFVFRM
jgi:opacity protein-like surface antigen